MDLGISVGDLLNKSLPSVPAVTLVVYLGGWGTVWLDVPTSRQGMKLGPWPFIREMGG